MSVGNGAISSAAVLALANRLKMIQVEFADRPANERRAQMIDEVKRAILSLNTDEKMTFLNTLAEQFPAWNVRLQPEKEENPVDLMEKLLATLRTVDPATRTGVVRRLLDTGMFAGGLSAEVLREFEKQKLGKPDSTWVAEMFLVMYGMLQRLDETFLRPCMSDWLRNTPQPPAKGLLEVVQRYFAQGAERGKVKPEVDQWFETFQCRVKSIADTLKKLPELHAEKYAATAIEELVVKSPFKNTNALCWEKYVSMCGGTDARSLQFKVDTMVETILTARLSERAAERAGGGSPPGPPPTGSRRSL